MAKIYVTGVGSIYHERLSSSIEEAIIKPTLPTSFVIKPISSILLEERKKSACHRRDQYIATHCIQYKPMEFPRFQVKTTFDVKPFLINLVTLLSADILKEHQRSLRLRSTLNIQQEQYLRSAGMITRVGCSYTNTNSIANNDIVIPNGNDWVRKLFKHSVDRKGAEVGNVSITQAFNMLCAELSNFKSSASAHNIIRGANALSLINVIARCSLVCRRLKELIKYRKMPIGGEEVLCLLN